MNIKKQFKNRQRSSKRDTVKSRTRRSSNSFKQCVEPRKGKESALLYNRLLNKKIYDKYCRFEESNDYERYLMDDIDCVPVWKCSECTYLNIERLSYCAICEFSFYANSNDKSSKTPCIPVPSMSLPFIDISTKKKKQSKKPNANHSVRSSSHSKRYLEKQRAKELKELKEKERIKKNEERLKKIENDKQMAQQLADMYGTVYLSQNMDDKNMIGSVLESMIKFIPKQHNEHHINDEMDDKKKEENDILCKVCYCNVDDLISMNNECCNKKHESMICKDCFSQYLAITIKSKDIMPWLLCPAEDCKTPVSVELLLKHIPSIQLLYEFCALFIGKHLARYNQYWRECPTDKCKYGWTWKTLQKMNKNNTNYVRIQCDACQTMHKMKAPKNGINTNVENDAGLKELYSSGILRKCPKCKYPAMKDKGMCNVMHCGKCGIYWNWRTFKTGTSSAQVKQDARNTGSLWEPGELRYHVDLQQTDLPQFIKLLARNGIKYDPNYRRGT